MLGMLIECRKNRVEGSLLGLLRALRRHQDECPSSVMVTLSLELCISRVHAALGFLLRLVVCLGFLLGAAFGGVVKAMVDNVLMPPLGLLAGELDFTDRFFILQDGDPPGPYATLAAAREAAAMEIQEIVLDETPIGPFLEIEGDPDGIRAVTADLGLDPSDYMVDSYVDLFFAQGGQGDMVFDPPPGEG